MKTLRPYQREAIDALYKYWQSSTGHGVIVVPTGGGKSLIMAAIIKEICEKWPGTRILVLAHVRELIQQNYDEIKGHWPEADIGIYSAGLGRKDHRAQVLVAGIQSIADKIERLDPAPEIVIIDECHLIPRNDSTRYKKTLKTLAQMYPHLRVVGLSATPYRLDSGWLHVGDGAIFDAIIYDIPIQRLINEGYLSPVVTKATRVKIKTDGVGHIGKEFSAHELEQSAMADNTTERIVADMIERAKDRRKWLVFACGVAHAQQLTDALNNSGIPSAIITGETPEDDRDSIIDAYKGNALEPIRAIVNVQVLTTGFNVPSVDFIALCRPTESVGLYVQMVGRGTRRAEGKTDCLVADYAGLTIRHGPIDAVDPNGKPYTEGSDGIPPAKECPNCMTIILAGLKVCPICGFEFPIPPPALLPTPAESPILKSQQELEMHDVADTVFEIHRKAGKKDSVKITYWVGLSTVNEWIFPESSTQWGDFFYRKTCREMGISEPFPATAEEFVSRWNLPKAFRIATKQEGRFTKVVRHEWRKRQFEDVVPF